MPGVSYQIYSALTYDDRLLLGHYPTGEIYEYAGGDLKLLDVGINTSFSNESANAISADNNTLLLFKGLDPESYGSGDNYAAAGGLAKEDLDNQTSLSQRTIDDARTESGQ